MGFRSRFAQLLDEAPEGAPAIEFEGRWVSWGLLQSVSRAIDAILHEHSFGEGTRVGIVLENRPEHVGAMLGLMATRRCLVTLSPLQPPERLSADIERSDVPFVVVSTEMLARPGIRESIEKVGHVIELDPTGRVSVSGASIGSTSTASPDTAIEMLTSGTTGPPKRVRLSDRQFDRSLETSVPEPKPDVLFRNGVSLVYTPLVHIGGLWGAVSALYSGRKIVLMHRFVLDQWVDSVERHRPRAAGLVPGALRAVLDADVPAEKLSSLQVVTSGTTFCPPDLADAFFDKYGIRVLMTYGATEFAGAIAAWTLPMHQKWWASKSGSAGRAMPGVDLQVVGPDGEALPVGETGLLEVRSAQSSAGSGTWVRTSDLARVDADGFVFIVGRADDAIVRGGFKVQPAEVAQVLERHPSVREASVAPFPDDRLGHVPVAGVELVPGALRPAPEELIALCREFLMPYEVPVHVVVLDELPRTPSSKVSRVDLLDAVQHSMLLGKSA
ncbi:AMP-binding protein [Aeromicrobium sp. SMF47]|uniref:class I adenylate-forming enzyme family protein n=1 Tax=Aeromicrobium yanjiei TaxID=2662028 RepID=UPI0013FB41BC|nr:AMP-binding protein [Aeromicrobium yanjiei]